MAKYKLIWREVAVWTSEVEAKNEKEAISKVYNDEVQEIAEVEHSYDYRAICAKRVK